MEANNPDLEIFRQQWQDEVTARSRTKASGASRRGLISAQNPIDRSLKLQSKHALPSTELPKDEFEPVDGVSTQAYHDLEDKDEKGRLGSDEYGTHPSDFQSKEPKSALEHYEKAIEREDQGNFGDSVSLYRKAFRLDAGVDRMYNKKHFPPSSSKSKPTNPNPSNAAVTVPTTAHHSLDGAPAPSITQLIASFSSVSSIPTEAPPTEGSPPPPCPIATVPSEILVEILLNTAIADIASFARLSVVCKRLAYLVATEDRIWERLCRGSEYGFTAMHYAFACSISGAPLPLSDPQAADPLDVSSLSLSHSITFSTARSPPPPVSLSLSQSYPTYIQMLRARPRLRFNGCYISTVNYHRPGTSLQSSNATWSSPVHIVTYYRYLRFFRDGSCISLLTTTEPADVVHHLTQENMHSHHSRESMLPSAVMRHALRGRWRLSGHEPEDEGEGDVYIETEGVDPKYMFKMNLSLRSAGRAGGTRNNKLVWRGFWSYNRLTDDWAAFTLRNDRAFFWSRVKSYGIGSD